jgi:hypothetical protein
MDIVIPLLRDWWNLAALQIEQLKCGIKKENKS